MTTATMPNINTENQSNKWVEIARDVGPEFAAKVSQNDQDGRFAIENYEELRRRKLFSARVPAELGGGGATHREMCEFIRELAHYDSSTALAFSMHSHLLATLIWRHYEGLTPPSEPVLRKIASEELVMVSTGGSDWLEGSGTLEKVEGGYRYNGRKVFSSGSLAGHLLLTTGVYDDPENGPTVLHFAVNLKGEGVTIMDDWDTMGMRATGSNSIMLENIFIPEAGISLSRPQGKWAPFFDVISPIAWSLVMSAYVGVAETARNIAVSKVANKKDDPIVQEIVGEMDTELLIAQNALRSITDIVAEDFQPSVENSNLTYKNKTALAKASIRTVERSMEAIGGASFFRSIQLERLFRDIQAVRFHPFQEKKQYAFTGRVALGLDPIE